MGFFLEKVKLTAIRIASEYEIEINRMIQIIKNVRDMRMVWDEFKKISLACSEAENKHRSNDLDIVVKLIQTYEVSHDDLRFLASEDGLNFFVSTEGESV